MAEISKKESMERLSVSSPTVTMLASAGLIVRVGRGYDDGSVDRLAAQRHLTYAPWNQGDRLGVGLPLTTRGGWNYSLYLDAGNDRAVAVAQMPPQQGQDVSGWWSIGDPMARMLVEQGGVLLGTTGTFVHQAARVLDVYTRQDRRRVFLVKPIIGEDLASYLGVIPHMTQKNGYVALP